MSVQYEKDDEEFGESKDVKVVEDDIYYETDEEEFNPGVSSHRFAAREEDDRNDEGVGLVGAQYETDEEEFNEMPSSDMLPGRSRLDTTPVVMVTAPVLVGGRGKQE